MSLFSILPIRKNLRELFSHCEELLASALAPDHAPLSTDELRMICYYANELARHTAAQRVRSNGKPALR
jgi:hypothetical protein